LREGERAGQIGAKVDVDVEDSGKSDGGVATLSRSTAITSVPERIVVTAEVENGNAVEGKGSFLETEAGRLMR
jgi:hypothetical protein